MLYMVEQHLSAAAGRLAIATATERNSNATVSEHPVVTNYEPGPEGPRKVRLRVNAFAWTCARDKLAKRSTQQNLVHINAVPIVIRVWHLFPPTGYHSRGLCARSQQVVGDQRVLVAVHSHCCRKRPRPRRLRPAAWLSPSPVGRVEVVVVDVANAVS